jgi:hypothetical protein
MGFVGVFKSHSSNHPVRLRGFRKIDVRLPGKGDSRSHGARPVQQIISMIKWIRTSRLKLRCSLSRVEGQGGWGCRVIQKLF